MLPGVNRRPMRTPALLATLAFVALALAGCSGGDGDGDSDSTSSSTSASKSATSTSSSSSKSATATSSSSSTTTTAPSNQPPSGSVSAAINGTQVTFSLAGSDADGDELSWTLDYGDGSDGEDGTTLPANVTHAYAVGNYTANFTLDDGTATKSYEVPVAVTGGAGASGLVFEGTVSAYCGLCTDFAGEQAGSPLPGAFMPSASWNSGEQGTDSVWVAIPAELAGHAFVATTSLADVGVAAMSACEPTAAVLELHDDEGTPENGVIPAGTGCLLLWEFLDPLAPAPPAEATLALTVA
jgi:hypothetical protein